MNLFLSWWWDYKKTENLDKKYIDFIWINWKILYIPIAMKWPYQKCLNWFNSIYKDLYWIQNITMIEDLNQISQEQILEFDSIYIWWWNTFYLMNEINKSGFWDIIKSFPNIPWKSIYWGSAWAIILWKSFKQALIFDENIVWLGNFSWINLLNWKSVICHYEALIEEEVKKYEVDAWPIIRLKEEEWIVIIDWKVNFVW